MKFGKFISTQTTEWAQHNMQYKALKKIINSIPHDDFLHVAASPPAGMEGEGLDSIQQLKTTFFYKLERELERVNSFYLAKEDELKKRLKVLLERRSTTDMQLLQSIRQALNLFLDELVKLQKYVEINQQGFIKILKKWDKRSKSSVKELYLSRQVTTQPCFQTKSLADMTDLASNQLQELEAKLGDFTDYDEESLGSSYTSTVPTDFPSQSTSKLEVTQSFFKLIHVKPLPVDQIYSLLSSLELDYADEIFNRIPLHEACILGNVDLVQQMLARSNVNAVDLYGRTPLHYVTLGGFVDLVHLLIKEPDLELDPIDLDDNTPLIYAIQHGHAEIVKALLENGSEIEKRDYLCLACNYQDTIIIETLLRYSNVNIIGQDGFSPLHLAAKNGFYQTAKLLLDKGANVNQLDKFNSWSPLFYSSSEGWLNVTKLLLEGGADKFLKDEHGWTPFTYSLWRGHIEVSELLEIPVEEVVSVSVVQEAIPLVPSELFKKDVDKFDNDLPPLSLPPPIVPFRIYGHNYLENSLHLSVTLGHPDKPPLTLFGSRQLGSFKLVISTKQESQLPHTVIFPLVDPDEWNIVVEELSSLQFDLYPTFGTKVLARGIALQSTLETILHRGLGDGTSPLEQCTVALLDKNLKVVGELNFVLRIVTPFTHDLLGVGKVETYWKSKGLAQQSITASSLVEEYVVLSVGVLNDVVVVGKDIQAGKDWKSGELGDLSGLTSKEIVKKIYQAKLDLSTVLNKLPPSLGVTLLIQYPFQRFGFNINDICDKVLKCVYDAAKLNRSVVLGSFNPHICTCLTWKQPNYAVFFCSNVGYEVNPDPICMSLKEAVKFAQSTNLLGVIVKSTPLKKCPMLVESVKEGGLLLVEWNEKDDGASLVDGWICDDVFRYNTVLDQ